MKVVVIVWGMIGVLCLGNGDLLAQITRGGQPIDFVSHTKAGKEQTWYRTPVPAIDMQTASAESAQDRELANKPLKCAFPFYVSLTPANSGEWEVQGNYRIWKLGIESKGARSIGLGFGKYKLPPGARLYVYNETRTNLIGAFTESNNKAFGKLTTMPVEGDKIFIQYEELVDSGFEGELEISRISHVYVDLKLTDDRRPKGLSGECNVDISCGVAEDFANVKNSVCRIYIPKPDRDIVCTGTLINNTASNGKPYLIAAAHCIENSTQAQESLFLFNYESPYCGSIDGDDNHSLEGSTLKARFDSLDFSLVELSVAPPNYFRPYYAGWDVSGAVPSRSFSVHHPLGDIKKIAVDNNSPTTTTFPKYLKNAFWEIGEWDIGVTEDGSSGCPLFNQDERIIGTLTGGDAYCSYPLKDDFAKLKLAWNYRKEQSKQLKYWLDPINTGETKIDGYEPYSGELKCGAFTNFTIADTTQLKLITENAPSNGYLTGTNTAGYIEFAEKFSGLKSCELNGVSIGIAKKYINDRTRDVLLSIKVYEGDDLPRHLLYSQNFVLNELAAGAMNYLAFARPLSTSGNFFISCCIDPLNPGDMLALYQAKRETANNSFFLKNADGWTDYKTAQGSTTGSALLMELVACSVDDGNYSPVLKDTWPNEIKVFPNPLASGGKLTVQFSKELGNFRNIKVYNLLGQRISCQVISENENQVQLQLRDARMGIYLLQIESGGKKYMTKISVVP